MIPFVDNSGWKGCGTILNASLNCFTGAAFTAVVSAIAASTFQSTYACAVAAVWCTGITITLGFAGVCCLAVFLVALSCAMVPTTSGLLAETIRQDQARRMLPSFGRFLL